MRDVTVHKPWRNVGALSTRYNLGPSVQPPLWNNIDVDQYPQQRRYGINIEDDRGITISRSRESQRGCSFPSIEFLAFIDRFRYFDRNGHSVGINGELVFPFHFFFSLHFAKKHRDRVPCERTCVARWRTKHITDCLYLHVGVVGACFS